MMLHRLPITNHLTRWFYRSQLLLIGEDERGMAASHPTERSTASWGETGTACCRRGLLSSALRRSDTDSLGFPPLSHRSRQKHLKGRWARLSLQPSSRSPATFVGHAVSSPSAFTCLSSKVRAIQSQGPSITQQGPRLAYARIGRRGKARFPTLILASAPQPK